MPRSTASRIAASWPGHDGDERAQPLRHARHERQRNFAMGEHALVVRDDDEPRTAPGDILDRRLHRRERRA